MAPGSYQFVGQPVLLADRAGNGLADSALVLSFEVDAATAVIRGQVQTELPGAIWVEAMSKGGATYAARADAVGRFALDGLLAGTYTLWAFADSDGDGVHSSGALDPFRPSEPYGRYEEPISLETGQVVEVVEIRCR